MAWQNETVSRVKALENSVQFLERCVDKQRGDIRLLTERYRGLLTALGVDLFKVTATDWGGVDWELREDIHGKKLVLDFKEEV